MEAAGSAPKPEGRVLATLNADGSRRWLRPRLSTGGFWRARRVVAYLLMVVFVAVPFVSIGGKPLLRLDVAAREFHFFGRTFLPSDTLLMALLMITIFVSIFLITALFGRVWCGWACPQTVYMEFLYRPIERFFEGGPGKKAVMKGPANVRRFMKYGVFVFASLFVAHTFLTYFIGPETLWAYMKQSPLEHPVAFLVMAGTTAAMLFNFGFFREQTCLVACPYGRFQAALLDQHSLIVTYNERRGEPRGKKGKKKAPVDPDVHLKVMDPQVAAADVSAEGDCIDCKLCVTTCPTGIDIRDGLQMECIGCAQCIDACNAVMDKIGRERNLICYSSQAVMAGEHKRLLRPRTFLYPTVLVVLMSVFLVVLGGKTTAEAQFLPAQGKPYYDVVDAPELVSNQLRMRLTNRSDDAATYTVMPTDPARFVSDAEPVTLAAGETRIVSFIIALPREVFDGYGVFDTPVFVSGTCGYESEMRYRAKGPRNKQTDGGAE